MLFPTARGAGDWQHDVAGACRCSLSVTGLSTPGASAPGHRMRPGVGGGGPSGCLEVARLLQPHAHPHPPSPLHPRTRVHDPADGSQGNEYTAYWVTAGNGMAVGDLPNQCCDAGSTEVNTQRRNLLSCERLVGEGLVWGPLGTVRRRSQARELLLSSQCRNLAGSIWPFACTIVDGDEVTGMDLVSSL